MTPHQKIMRAANRGTGLRLTAEEVGRLSRDGAIETCAANDDEDDRSAEIMKIREKERKRKCGHKHPLLNADCLDCAKEIIK